MVPILERFLFCKVGFVLTWLKVCHQFNGDKFVSSHDLCLSFQMYRDCGHIEKAINLLEEYVNTRRTNMNWSLLDLLISLYLRNNAISEALKQIEEAHQILGSKHKLPVQLQAKAVICHAYLGDMKHAEVCS
jgi:DNA-binding SARP family transcriptional activator